MAVTTTTALIVSTAVSVLSAGAGAYMKHKQNQEMAKAKEREADIARERAAYTASRQEEQTKAILSEMEAGYAASGVQLGVEGDSAHIAMSETARQAEIERQQILRGGEWEAGSRELEADAYRSGAGWDVASGIIGVGGSLLTGVSKYGAYKQTEDVRWLM